MRQRNAVKRSRWKQTAEERFWAKVDKTGDCHIWIAARSPKGYGVFFAEGIMHQAHRWSWQLRHGQAIPEGMCVCHRCDNPPCVRADHLFLGTRADNLYDMVAKGRESFGVYQQVKTHCPKGHPYSPENTYVTHDKHGHVHRRCRICRDDGIRAARALQKAQRQQSQEDAACG